MYKELMTLYQGHNKGYNVVLGMTGTKDSGKKEVSMTTKKEPVTEDVWKAHLDEGKNIGLCPVREDNTCVFGIIDIDVYKGIKYDKLAKTIKDHEIPVILCLSKSMGIHAVLFTSEPVPAKLMREKLEEIGKVFELDYEVFPKQNTVDLENGIGSCISMPYAGVNNTDPKKFRRFGYVSEDLTPLSVDEFIEEANKRKVSKRELEDLNIAGFDPDAQYNGAPSCLVKKLNGGKWTESGRNDLMFNIATYYVKKGGNKDDLETKISEWNNNLLDEPLSLKELIAIADSVDKKSYHFKNRKGAECVFCSKMKCESMDRSNASTGILFKKLTKLEGGDETIWNLTFEVNSQLHNIRLNTEELNNPKKVQVAILDKSNVIYPAPKQDLWVEILNGLLQTVSVEVLPEGARFEDRLHEHMEMLFESASPNKEVVLTNGIYRDIVNNEIMFKPSDFMRMLNYTSFKFKDETQVMEALYLRYGAQARKIRVDGKRATVIVISAANFELTTLIENDPQDVISTDIPF